MLTVSSEERLVHIPKCGVLGMTLNCMRWLRSGPGYLSSVKNHFIAITTRSTLFQSGSTCWGPVPSMYQIDLFIVT